MDIKKVTLSDVLQEMQSFVSVDANDIQRAKETGIKVSNNPEFNDLVDGWINGMYDEDPNALVSELLNLIDKVEETA